MKIKNILLISAIALAIAVFAAAQTQEELQAELTQLEQELTDANYSWYLITNKFISDDNLMLSTDNKILTI